MESATNKKQGLAMQKSTLSNIIQPDWPAPEHIIACCTTRTNGCSDEPYDSFNLAMHVDDKTEDVAKNRAQLQATLELKSQIKWLQQTHSNQAVAITDKADGTEADACFTQNYQTACAVLTADCLPILLCNDSGTEIAAIHAGWKGILNGVIENCITALQSPPSRLYAWLGPAISSKHFELSDAIRLDFMQKLNQNKHAFTQQSGAWLADIYHLGRIALETAGVNQIFGGEFCTYSDSERFYSYRRDQGKTGRMASLIFIR